MAHTVYLKIYFPYDLNTERIHTGSIIMQLAATEKIYNILGQINRYAYFSIGCNQNTKYHAGQ